MDSTTTVILGAIVGGVVFVLGILGSYLTPDRHYYSDEWGIIVFFGAVLMVLSGAMLYVDPQDVVQEPVKATEQQTYKRCVHV